MFFKNLQKKKIKKERKKRNAGQSLPQRAGWAHHGRAVLDSGCPALQGASGTPSLPAPGGSHCPAHSHPPLTHTLQHCHTSTHALTFLNPPWVLPATNPWPMLTQWAFLHPLPSSLCPPPAPGQPPGHPGLSFPVRLLEEEGTCPFSPPTSCFSSGSPSPSLAPDAPEAHSIHLNTAWPSPSCDVGSAGHACLVAGAWRPPQTLPSPQVSRLAPALPSPHVSPLLWCMRGQLGISASARPP